MDKIDIDIDNLPVREVQSCLVDLIGFYINIYGEGQAWQALKEMCNCNKDIVNLYIAWTYYHQRQKKKKYIP